MEIEDEELAAYMSSDDEFNKVNNLAWLMFKDQMEGMEQDVKEMK